MKDELKSKLEDTKLVAGMVGAVLGLGMTVYTVGSTTKEIIRLKRLERSLKKEEAILRSDAE